MANPYNLCQGLAWTERAHGIQLGSMPPVGMLIDTPPSFLVDLLCKCSAPQSYPALVEIARATGGLTVEAAKDLIEELIADGILTPTWIELGDRYSRHDLYFDLVLDGHPRSAQLAATTVAIIGVGGIGTNVAMQLAAAGVGGLILVDADHVEASNLTRQFLFTESDIGRLKVEAAEDALRLRNAAVAITTHPHAPAGPADLAEVLTSADVAVLSADTPVHIAQWTNDAAFQTSTPFSCAGYRDGVGIVGPLIVPGVTGCLECFEIPFETEFDGADDAVDGDNLNDQYQTPSFGPLNAIVAGIQCSELLKFCLGAEVVTMDRCIAFDSVAMESDSRQYRPNPLCKWCGVEGSAPAASRYTNSPDPIEDRDGGTGSAATRTSWSLSELPEVLAVSPRSSGTLRLRLPRSSDAGALFGNLTSSTRVTRYLSWSPHERESQTLEFLDYLDSANRGGDERTWVIAEDIADEPIGLFSCWLDKPFSTEVGVCLGSGWWNRGIMTACLRTVIDTLRDVPAIYRVWATCDVDNVRSATVMERAGMHHEGLLTRHAIRPNLTDEPRDSLMYGMALR